MATTKPKQGGDKTRKVPQRRCVGCGGTFDKKDLLRIVRAPEQTPAETPDGNIPAVPAADRISIDFTGKKSGRGAYICKDVKCLKKARKSRRIDKNLECEISDAVYDAMEEELNENVG